MTASHMAPFAYPAPNGRVLVAVRLAVFQGRTACVLDVYCMILSRVFWPSRQSTADGALCGVMTRAALFDICVLVTC
jgi:hypothetical protein